MFSRGTSHGLLVKCSPCRRAFWVYRWKSLEFENENCQRNSADFSHESVLVSNFRILELTFVLTAMFDSFLGTGHLLCICRGDKEALINVFQKNKAFLLPRIFALYYARLKCDCDAIVDVVGIVEKLN